MPTLFAPFRLPGLVGYCGATSARPCFCYPSSGNRMTDIKKAARCHSAYC